MHWKINSFALSPLGMPHSKQYLLLGFKNEIFNWETWCRQYCTTWLFKCCALSNFIDAISVFMNVQSKNKTVYWMFSYLVILQLFWSSTKAYQIIIFPPTLLQRTHNFQVSSELQHHANHSIASLLWFGWEISKKAEDVLAEMKNGLRLNYRKSSGKKFMIWFPVIFFKD